MSACVVIVSYRTGPALQACLAALKNTADIAEIVLADNGNEAEETGALDTFAAGEPRARLLRGQGNVGFAAACNLGARAARSEVLVFANPDVIFAPDAITRLEAALAAAPPPAVVGGDLRDGKNRPERGSRRERLTMWRAFVYFTGLTAFEPFVPALRNFNRHADPLPAAPVRVGAVSGALMALRRADFETLGGFDEGYFLHVEDIDFCRRAEEKGWPVLFVPGPHGKHLRSTSAVDARTIARHKARGMARYFRKFARGPIESLAAEIAGGLLMLVSR